MLPVKAAHAASSVTGVLIVGTGMAAAEATHACPERVMTAVLSHEGIFCPTRIQGGDGDFRGNGPIVRLEAYLHGEDTDKLRLNLSWEAEEKSGTDDRCAEKAPGKACPGGATVVAASHANVPVWTAPEGCKVKEIHTGIFSRASYEDSDQALDIVPPANPGFVSEFLVMGDTGGGDVNPADPAACTADDHHVRLHFEPVEVLVGE